MGIDEVGIDKVGIDEVGRYLGTLCNKTSGTPKWELTKWELTNWEDTLEPCALKLQGLLSQC